MSHLVSQPMSLAELLLAFVVSAHLGSAPVVCVMVVSFNWGSCKHRAADTSRCNHVAFSCVLAAQRAAFLHRLPLRMSLSRTHPDLGSPFALTSRWLLRTVACSQNVVVGHVANALYCGSAAPGPKEE
eukprot:TRINITY_DN56719_c0_g1_i1.p1 TRINITY_DN56719_c0_g1~~TRINITY_DN56719_c0_g1_i1.p1  ORF type:complete len:128 (+),score=4.52 TRINITY_DN56719_c0_g1_i1:277-660(+)